ncbi:hypothetical protein ACFL3S_01820 [Gemmatimonadota bacterium]
MFRLHVGAALLQRDREEIGELPSWAKGQSAPKAVREMEVGHERRVSAHIGRMTVLWIAIPDPPGPENLRAYVEKNAIALLSNGLAPIDRPSPEWLGLHSPRREIRGSGLWNLNHVTKTYDPSFLQILGDLVDRMSHRRA